MLSSARRRVVRNLAALAAMLVGSPIPSPAADRPPAAIKGYDPVAYFRAGKPVRGRQNLWYDWDERRYYFSSAENRDLFRSNPVRYAPQFPDLCAMSLTRGEIVEANPENWLIADGKLYMFGKTVGPELFRQDLAKNIASANQNRGVLPGR